MKASIPIMFCGVDSINSHLPNGYSTPARISRPYHKNQYTNTSFAIMNRRNV